MGCSDSRNKGKLGKRKRGGVGRQDKGGEITEKSELYESITVRKEAKRAREKSGKEGGRDRAGRVGR